MSAALDRWLAYARRFGTECVYEEAREDLDTVELDRLAQELRRLDREWKLPDRQRGRPLSRPLLAPSDGRCCRRCGRPLSGRADRRYCSDACRVAAHRAQKVRPEVQTPSIRAEFAAPDRGAAVTYSGSEGSRSRRPVAVTDEPPTPFPEAWLEARTA